MPTPYKLLSDGILTRLKSSGLHNITENELDEIIFDYIKPAAVKFKACRQNLADKDEAAKIFNIDLTDEETEILINLMLVEYLSANYINVPSLLRQSLTSKDFQVFSSRNHLDGLMSLRDMYKKEARQMISIYSNTGSELFSMLKSKNNDNENIGNIEDNEDLDNG